MAQIALALAPSAWVNLTPSENVTADVLKIRTNAGRVELVVVNLSKTTNSGTATTLPQAFRPGQTVVNLAALETPNIVYGVTAYATGGVYVRPGNFEGLTFTVSWPLG